MGDLTLEQPNDAGGTTALNAVGGSDGVYFDGEWILEVNAPYTVPSFGPLHAIKGVGYGQPGLNWGATGVEG